MHVPHILLAVFLSLTILGSFSVESNIRTVSKCLCVLKSVMHLQSENIKLMCAYERIEENCLDLAIWLQF